MRKIIISLILFLAIVFVILRFSELKNILATLHRSNYRFLVAALAVLPIARGWRLAWAGRAWAIALGSFVVAWAADGGHLSHAPSLELVLVPAAAGLAVAIACGAAAFETDVRGTRLGASQLVSAVAVRRSSSWSSLVASSRSCLI